MLRGKGHTDKINSIREGAAVTIVVPVVVVVAMVAKFGGVETSLQANGTETN